MASTVTLPRLGATSNVQSFSVQEDATPIDPSSSGGGVGTISATLNEFQDAPLLLGGIILSDGSRGKTSGAVRSVSTADQITTVTADSVLGLLNTDRVAQPYVGTLGGAMQYYCDLVGITNDVTTDVSVASRPVVYPGWTGNAWMRVKQILAVEQVEMALVFDRVSIRPLRTLQADPDRLTTSGWDINSDGAARYVDVNYYNNTAGSQLEVFPLTTETPQILVISYRETQVIRQQMNGTLSSVNQPVMQAFVNNASYAGTAGVYSITGSDDLPIQPAQWITQGGSITVAIAPEDPSVLIITLKGANIPSLSPFRVAMSSGSSNYYNSLHITGQGVVWDKKSVRMTTGASNFTTSSEVGVVVENPFIRTLSQAYSTGLKTSAAYAGVNYTVSGSAYALNRSGDGRELVAATIADFNAFYADTSMAEFNAIWAGSTIAEFNAYWNDQMSMLWENQLFGNAPGARVLTPDANFRVVNATTNESSVQFSAALDTTVSDFNGKWGTGVDISYFNSQFSGYTCKDFSLVPLRKEE